MVISSMMIITACRNVSASGEFICIEEVDVPRMHSRGTGSLNPLWTASPPFNTVAAIPVVAKGIAISPFPQKNESSVEYRCFDSRYGVKISFSPIKSPKLSRKSIKKIIFGNHEIAQKAPCLAT
jgi:hypothetical protein